MIRKKTLWVGVFALCFGLLSGPTAFAVAGCMSGGTTKCSNCKGSNGCGQAGCRWDGDKCGDKNALKAPVTKGLKKAR